jgi:ribonuclease Z
MGEIIFLGTSAMVPTKERNHSGILLNLSDKSFLFDCGEGIQRQLKFAKIKITKIKRIFISHWHGDHVLGIPGVLQSIAASDLEDKKIVIYGPIGTKEKIEYMLQAFVFDNFIEIETHDIKKEGCFLEGDEFKIEAYYLEHSIECLGFAFYVKEKVNINKSKMKEMDIHPNEELKKIKNMQDITIGKKLIKAKEIVDITNQFKIGIIMDTRPCQGYLKIAENCDILISESTYEKKHKDKAITYKHMTSEEVSKIAYENNVKKLILTHFSQRYNNLDKLEEEAKEFFENLVLAKDFMKINF